MTKFRQISFSDLRFCDIKRMAKVSMAIAALSIGGFIYLIYRSENLLMFDWFADLGLNDTILKLRDVFGQINLWDWTVYNMPGALWLFSYLFLIDSIWEDNNSYSFKCFIMILPVAAIVSELLQFFKIFPGTFDILDVFSYILSILLYLTIKISNK